MLLLQKDYNALLIEAYKTPDKDLIKFFINFIDKNYSANPDIFIELKNAINSELQWYRKHVCKDIIWEVDENGNKQVYDCEKTLFPLFLDYGIRKHVNKEYYDKLYTIINSIEQQIINKSLEQEHTITKEVSLFEIMERSGFAKRFEKAGYTINNTFDFDKLKNGRLKEYEKEKIKLIKEAELHKNPLTDNDYSTLYFTWLNDELKVIETWLNNKQSNLSKIEIKKYKDFILNEISLTENNSLVQQEAKTEAQKEKLYNEYFKGNTFLLFKAYCDEYDVDNTCRTDLRVLFDLFTEYKFFIDTVELKHYLKFLKLYLKYDTIELRKVDLNTKPNIKRTNDFKRIKTNLKLTLE